MADFDTFNLKSFAQKLYAGIEVPAAEAEQEQATDNKSPLLEASAP